MQYDFIWTETCNIVNQLFEWLNFEMMKEPTGQARGPFWKQQKPYVWVIKGLCFFKNQNNRSKMTEKWLKTYAKYLHF